jgi:SAM-dependent methyltransferase
MNASSTFVATDGDGYELTMGRWSRRLAVPFVEFVGAGRVDKVLDVGCGTGHLAAEVNAVSRPREVHGVDLSASYIDHATRRHPDRHFVFRAGDAYALPYADGEFDLVLSLLMLHFVPEPGRAIAEMRRVAKAGSTVGAAVWDARGGFVANRMFFDTAAALDAAAAERRARNYTRPMTRPGDLAAAWRAAGWRDGTETVLGIRMEFSSFADYWTPYNGREGPGAEYVRTLDEAARDRLHDALRSAYLDGEADGPRSYAALAWAVKGTVPN